MLKTQRPQLRDLYYVSSITYRIPFPSTVLRASSFCNPHAPHPHLSIRTPFSPFGRYPSIHNPCSRLETLHPEGGPGGAVGGPGGVGGGVHGMRTPATLTSQVKAFQTPRVSTSTQPNLHEFHSWALCGKVREPLSVPPCGAPFSFARGLYEDGGGSGRVLFFLT